MKHKILVIILTIMLTSMASAYVPPELRTGEHMSEYEVIKVAMTAHDAGDNSRWVKYTLEDAAIHHTNSGRIVNDYAQLREYLRKIESQEVLKWQLK